MKLYLLRHAPAVPRSKRVKRDADRKLTREGVHKMEVAARGLPLILPKVDKVLTSPFKRAIDTAEIVREHVNCPKETEIIDLLCPETDVKATLKALKAIKGLGKILIIGHEPNLSKLAATLCGLAAEKIRLRKGGLCCIEITQTPAGLQGELLWLLEPKQLRMLGKGTQQVP